MPSPRVNVEFTIPEAGAVLEALEHFCASQKASRSPIPMELEWAYDRLFRLRGEAVDIKSELDQLAIARL